MADAQWSLAMPARHVDPDGTVTLIAEVTDDSTGVVGTITTTLTPDRKLRVLADGIQLDAYEAWSTT